MPLLSDLAIIFLATTKILSTCNAQLQARGHQHAIIRGHALEKPPNGPVSSTLKDIVDRPTITRPFPTKVIIGSKCTSQTCDRPDTTNVLNAFTTVEPVHQTLLHTLDFSPDPAATFPARRRLRTLSSRTSSIKGQPIGTVRRVSSANNHLPLSILTLSHALETNSNKNLDENEIIANRHGMRQRLVCDTLEAEERRNVLLPRQEDGYQSFVLGGFSTPTSSAVAPDDAYQSFLLSGFSSPTSSTAAASASSSSICPAENGTTYTSAAGIDYMVVCNTDFPDGDYPFQLVDSFAGCVQKCDAYNYDSHHVQCLAALFIPSREGYADDCYLKSSIANSTAATLLIEGAVRLGYSTSSTSSSATALSSIILSAAVATSSSVSAGMASVAAYGSGLSLANFTTRSSSAEPSNTTLHSVATPPSEKITSSPGITYASGNLVVPPRVASSYLQGPTENTPTKQYLDIESPPSIALPESLLTVGINSNLTTGYGLSPETGVLEVNSSTQPYLSPITDAMHLSRDGGKGGIINGEHLFIFCDTGSYSNTTSSANGNFLGFVSSSVAIDVGMNGLAGDVLNLQDGIGQWSDNVGRMRSFAPLTTGEQAYNLAMQGQGQRYAVWPESSIIPLDATTGIIYAPIVYDNVNEETKAAVFTYTGTTLLTITAGGKGGPIAQRSVKKIFNGDEVEWGCAGGIRGWGPSGIGGDDGYVYLFGNVGRGILLARVLPANVASRGSFEYWDGNAFTSSMQPSSSTAYFIKGSFMDADVFYSPRHLTFLIVYMTSYADSTFYYRYLKADQGIIPPYAPGGDSSSDFVEVILKYNWSEPQVLYKSSPGLSGKYIYSGGVHLGYYGSDDITNGGQKMLLSWTAPTGLDPSTLISEYQIPTAEITWA